MTTIKIGTRRSDLAMNQAISVRERLQKYHSHISVEIVGITTEGDRTLDTPLYEKGGKGLFLKELERSLIDGSIDVAVHSMKDVTITQPENLHIPVICERENPCDVLVSNKFKNLNELPEGAVIGTCSLRRQSLLKYNYPNVVVKNLRGNVNKRLAKLDSGEFDAIILAAAGLHRLGMNNRISEYIPTNIMIPAVGQGALGIQCRKKDSEITEIIKKLNHPPTHCRIIAERALNKNLDGGCHLPIGALAEIKGEKLLLRGFIGDPDGSSAIFAQSEGDINDPSALGVSVAEKLRNQGAARILKDL